MATRKPYTPPPPHPLFRDSFERHRHLIGPMLDGDEAALAALTATEDGFRAALYPNFCNDDTYYPIYDRYQDSRDLQPHFGRPIHLVARQHPEWIGNILLDPTVDGDQREEGIRASLFRAILRVFLPDEVDLEFMTPEERVAATSDRPLPAPVGEYALAVVKGERDADAPWYYDAMTLLTDFRPIPPGTHEALGRCIVSEPFREVKERLILFMDSDDATRHMDPALVPELRKIRSRLRRTMSKRAGEALDRIIVRLGGTPPVARPRKAPSRASEQQETRQPHPLFREAFERHRHHIEPMLNGDEQALAALTASEEAFRASLYPYYCDDDTDYTLPRSLDNWRARSDAFHRPLLRVLEEHPEWVENLLHDPVLDQSNAGKMIRSNVRVYAQRRSDTTSGG